MKKGLLFFFKVLFLVVQVSSGYGQSPGGVSGNLLFWVKSNSGVEETDGTTPEDGDLVDVMDDFSAADNDAIVGLASEDAGTGTRPTYRTNIINSYPALQFDGTKLLDSEAASGILDTESFNMFLVFKQNSYQTNGGTQDGNGTFIIDRPTATFNLTSFKVVNTDKYFYQRRQNDNNNLGGPVSATAVNTTYFVIVDYFRNYTNTTEGIYLNGAIDVSQAGVTGNITGPRIRIGRHATNLSGGLNGYFTEMIVYNTDLATTDRQRVQSYLALKYGITLSSTTDYVRRSGNTVIYPSTGTHSGYVADIAGIGRDNGGTGSAFLQTTSTSQNANKVVTVSGASDLDNNEFLIWGSNNGSLTVPSTSQLPTGILRKLSRVWRVAETGDVGTVTVAMDLTPVPGSKTASHLRLLVDADGFGSGAAATQYTVSSSSGSTYTFNNVDFANGAYFTIGTTNLATPLPIELSEFNLTYENPAVIASWQTASEKNNDYFTVERAGTDLAFDEIGRKSGAGTSMIPHSYSMIDSNPYEGTSYYRLKQTDFDGTVTYSDVRSIFIAESEKKLVVFPNPNEGKDLKISFGKSNFNLDHVEVFNQHGQSIESSSIDANDLREYSVELQHRLLPGLYLLRVHYNGKDEFVKLVVQTKN